MSTNAQPVLTAAELVKITGKPLAAQQARVLIKMGVPFEYLGRAVLVTRAAAEVHKLLPEQHRARGVNLSAVR